MGNYGANQFRAIPVPIVDFTDGAPISVADLAADMTFSLAGSFTGNYIIMGSQDGLSYSPITQWIGIVGATVMSSDVNANVAWVKVRRRSADMVVISVAGQLVCDCQQS